MSKSRHGIHDLREFNSFFRWWNDPKQSGSPVNKLQPNTYNNYSRSISKSTCYFFYKIFFFWIWNFFHFLSNSVVIRFRALALCWNRNQPNMLMKKMKKRSCWRMDASKRNRSFGACPVEMLQLKHMHGGCLSTNLLWMWFSNSAELSSVLPQRIGMLQPPTKTFRNPAHLSTNEAVNPLRNRPSYSGKMRNFKLIQIWHYLVHTVLLQFSC